MSEVVKRWAPVEVRRGRERITPLSVSPPDGRWTYFDLAYPWGSVCKVEHAGAVGSGVLIGPRHVLTASHVIKWNDPNWPKVTVHAYDSFNAGVALAPWRWCYTKVSNVDSGNVDEDYAVLILDSYLGNQRGYLGYRTYNSSWDGESWWKSLKLDEDDFDYGWGRVMITEDGDFMPMQSGSPVFSFFKKKKWWQVIGVVSGGEPGGNENYVAGGSGLTDLIAWARANYP